MQIQKSAPFKLIAILFMAGCIAYMVYGAYELMSQPKSSGDALAKAISDINSPPSFVTESSVVEGPAVKTSGPVEEMTPVVTKPLTASEIAEFKRWNTEHGYIPSEDAAVYKSYSNDVLEDLAKKGDVIALDELGTKFISEGKFSKAQQYFWDAAALGSTTALSSLAIITEPLPIPNETKEMRKELVRHSTLETLAIHKVVELRGDKRLSAASIRAVEAGYKARGGGPLELSPDELKWLDERAQTLYKSLEARRAQLGLEGFNNETPRMITDFINR